nr:putative uncharacterized protein C10orf113 homolog [Loxodonta africana]
MSQIATCECRVEIRKGFCQGGGGEGAGCAGGRRAAAESAPRRAAGGRESPGTPGAEARRSRAAPPASTTLRPAPPPLLLLPAPAPPIPLVSPASPPHPTPARDCGASHDGGEAWKAEWWVKEGLRRPSELVGEPRRPHSWPGLARWLRRGLLQFLQAGSWILSIQAVLESHPGSWAKSLGCSLRPEGTTRGKHAFKSCGTREKLRVSKKEQLKMTFCRLLKDTILYQNIYNKF